METTGATAAGARACGEDVVTAAAAPAAEKTQQAAANRPAAVVETKTETDRESVGSSDSAREQARVESEAAGAAEVTEESAAAPAASTSETKPAAKKLAPAVKKTPTAKMPSKAKAVSARKAKAAPTVNKALSFSAVKVRGERSTMLKALEKKADKPNRSGFHYTPYKGPLPPFSNSLFAPKEVQALERLAHNEAKPKPAAPTPKKPFLIKSTGKAGGVVGRAMSGAGKENAHVNTAAASEDKTRRRLAKPSVMPGRVSVKDKSTLSWQAKVRMDRRATVSSAAKARATQARQAARQSAPAVKRVATSKATTSG